MAEFDPGIAKNLRQTEVTAFDEEEEMELWRERFNTARNTMLNKCFFLIFSQISLISFLWVWIISPTTGEDESGSYHNPAPEVTVVLSRFICGFFLHIS